MRQRSGPEWFTVRELAARERVDPRTVRRWIQKGVLETRRLAPRVGVRVRLKER